MGIRRRELAALEPFLEGEEANEDGEWGMHCPLPSHQDNTRSASLNVETALWYCNVCDLGGRVADLVKSLPLLQKRIPTTQANGRSAPKVSEATVIGWHEALLAARGPLQEFMERRSLTLETLREFQIGWDSGSSAYTIPIRGLSGDITNVRRYQLDPADDRRKIWSIKGLGTPTLYPVDQLDAEEIVVCEGELDALITIQNGIPAITRTGAAVVWKDEWATHFVGKTVLIVQDMDEAGLKGAIKIKNSLDGVAASCRIVDLPYPRQADHGRDLTDFFQDGYGPEDFYEIAAEQVDEEPAEKPGKAFPPKQVDVQVLDSFDARNVGRPLTMKVTITGKRNPPYLVPKAVEYQCTQDAGVKCQICPMNEAEGQMAITIQEDDPSVLEMMNANKKALSDILRAAIGAQQCNMLTIDVTNHQAVEELHVRPAVDAAPVFGQAGDYTNRQIISVGRHDTLPNNTVKVQGMITPNPRGQQNEFLAWEVDKAETGIDSFELTPEGVRLMRMFQPGPKQTPLNKMGHISRDLVAHVTKIYGRLEMHILLDLVFHSVLSFHFGGSLVQRGWMDALIVGDTRTGKSEAMQRLVWHYAAGEMVSCESASFAGIVGGLQQFGSGKEWEVTWGAIPINDRRLVALDEVSGLSTEQIAQMSSIRSSGEAQLTKIRSERTYARTRLVWLGNPRDRRMSDYTFGVQAIRPLIGNNEDIARFDLAMSVSAGDVDTSEINRDHEDNESPTFHAAACRELLLWAWSRRPDQVFFTPGTEDLIYRESIELGKRYVESPPLIQAANVRIKLARVAVALAARTFSTDKETSQFVIVTDSHVHSAVEFIDHLYDLNGFGYRTISEELIKDQQEAYRCYDQAKEYVMNRKGLAKFLRGCGGRFRTQDLQDMMGLQRDEASALVNALWNYRMVSRDRGDVKITSILNELLREIEE